jgi:hypothetical protein
MRSSRWALVVLGCLACSGGGDNPQTPDAAVDAPVVELDAAPDAPGALGDILDELRAIPGLQVTEQSTMIAGYRFFTMTYDQPVDHANPGGQRFQQRMTLLHRDYAAPMVVYNSGYFVSQRGGRAEIARLLVANQLSMEYRYFSPSRPEPTDWTKLDIQQAASDQHRITAALKARLYQGKWLTTGASKGGMTSLFHRRFFPDDVDATVAYVAPIDYPEDAVQSPTNRYIAFLENVGTDPGCRQKLKDFQNLVLARRDTMKARMRAVATFTDILGEDRALEFAVEELPFIFWQYGDQGNCANIPGATASDALVFQFFDDTISVASYGDADLTDFLPYYHQSATQLGYPISDESYLIGLQFPGQDTARAYIPAAIPTPAYDDGAAMHDIQNWLAASGERVMLIYGQNDPWSAGAVSLGNHGSAIATLNGNDQAAAVAAVRRWAGVSAKRAAPLDPNERTAEQDELAFKRLHRLR